MDSTMHVLFLNTIYKNIYLTPRKPKDIWANSCGTTNKTVPDLYFKIYFQNAFYYGLFLGLLTLLNSSIAMT